MNDADDFDAMAWHDCHCYGIEIRGGYPEDGDWTSDLVLSLDYIAEWLCPVGDNAPVRFRVAPARLAFHGVTDTHLDIDWGDSAHRTAIHEISIDRVHREILFIKDVHLDRPYYRWSIQLNWPAGGEIRFGAWGYTLSLLAEPIVTDQQRLSPAQRARLIGP